MPVHELQAQIQTLYQTLPSVIDVPFLIQTQRRQEKVANITPPFQKLLTLPQVHYFTP